MKLRLSVRVLLLLIAVIGGVLAVIRWNDPAVRYRREHDEASLNAVLSRRIENGDPIEKVNAILGAAVINTDPKLRRSATSFALQLPSQYPSGVNGEDEFREYKSGPGMLVILQFRAGRLINFHPRDFAGPVVPATSVSR